MYAPGGSLNPPQLTWFDRAGKTLGTLGEGGVDVNLSLSPDERQVAVALRSGSPENLDIWTIDIARNLRNRVTSDAQPEGWPVWSPDGTRIVFGSGARGGRGLPEKARLVQTLVNGTGANETLLEAVGTPSRPCGPRQCYSRADRLVRRRTFRAVHVQRVVSGDIGHLGPSALWGPQTVSSSTHSSSPRVWERSPRTADGSPTRPTRPASPTSTFSHFFAPAGNIGSRRMEDAIRTGGPMAKSCSISMRTGR